MPNHRTSVAVGGREPVLPVVGARDAPGRPGGRGRGLGATGDDGPVHAGAHARGRGGQRGQAPGAVPVVGQSGDVLKGIDRFFLLGGKPARDDGRDLVSIRFHIHPERELAADAKGRLVKEWRGVKVPGHVDEVLEFVANLG